MNRASFGSLMKGGPGKKKKKEMIEKDISQLSFVCNGKMTEALRLGTVLICFWCCCVVLYHSNIYIVYIYYILCSNLTSI